MGWQGWLLRSGETRILVDPLLVDAVGRGTPETRQRFVTWPPRTFDWQHFPAIDGLFLSHEHEDHFNIASLARIDRSVPVWMSAWSSVAARTALEELGFELRLLGPEQQIELGELSLRSFGADHRQGEQQDEWDTLAYELSSAEGRLFTNVDVPVTAAMREQLREREGSPLSFVGMGLSLGLPAEANPRAHHRPPSSAEIASGSSALSELRAGRQLRPLAGQTVLMHQGALAGFSERTPFLSTPPREQWPAAPRFWPDPTTQPAPLLSGRDLEEPELDELGRELDRFATYLYGRALFRELLSLSPAQLEGRAPSFVLLLRSGPDSAYAYRYELQSCSFVPLEPEELGELSSNYAGLLVGWAEDLLEALRGHFEPRGLVSAVRERWFVPVSSGVLIQSLWPYLHPLNQVQRCLAQYRRAIAAEREAPILVKAKARP